MFIADGDFYSDKLDQYARDQHIQLPPLYSKSQREPNHEKGITIQIKLPNFGNLTMQTTIATTGAEVKEFLRSNQVDTRDLLLASQTGIIDDSMFINRIGLHDNAAIVVVPKGSKKKGIQPMRSLCAMPSLRSTQFINAVTIEPETKIRASSSIRSVFPKFNRHSLPF